jgi:hypothetical protein
LQHGIQLHTDLGIFLRIHSEIRVQIHMHIRLRLRRHVHLQVHIHVHGHLHLQLRIRLNILVHVHYNVDIDERLRILFLVPSFPLHCHRHVKPLQNLFVHVDVLLPLLFVPLCLCRHSTSRV